MGRIACGQYPRKLWACDSRTAFGVRHLNSGPGIYLLGLMCDVGEAIPLLAPHLRFRVWEQAGWYRPSGALQKCMRTFLFVSDWESLPTWSM